MKRSNEEERPRKIVRKRAHGGHHGGAWKVAYADFVTAMMSLFIVLWIVGQNKAVKEAVAGYFKDPVGYTKGGGQGVLKGGTGPGGTTNPVPVPPPTKAPVDSSDRAVLEAAAASLKGKIFKEHEFENLKDKVKIDLVDEGLRIQLVETGQGAFFDVGSAAVKAPTREIMARIAHEVAKLPNDIKVEGHTDSRPYVGQPNYSNWELSADRANMARRILESNGVRPSQVSDVVGYADRHLANRADPFDAANRRISIIVRVREVSDGKPPGAAPAPPAKPPS